MRAGKATRKKLDQIEKLSDSETENKSPEAGMKDAMLCTWAELRPETRVEIFTQGRDESDYLRKLAEDTFVRKSKTLTLMNAGGIIAVASYIGPGGVTVDGYVITTFASFFIGLILNVIVMFRAEWRRVKKTNDYMELKKAFMSYESLMTVEQFNKKLDEAEISTTWESIGEGLSGLAFVIGMITAICSMFNAIS